MIKRKLSLALCSGRHYIPQAVDGAVFNGIVDPINIKLLEEKATQALQWCSELDLYVTGLTVAQDAVINVCADLGIKLTVWHYNCETGNYYPQKIRIN